MGETQHLDHDYAGELLARLGGIPEGRRPLWGRMNKEHLVAHLLWYVAYSLDQIPTTPLPFLPTRQLLRFYYLNLPFHWPRHLGSPVTGRAEAESSAGNLLKLQALLTEYLAQVQADDFTPPAHPVFGAIGIDGWDRFHVRHFEHHLRQFGV